MLVVNFDSVQAMVIDFILNVNYVLVVNSVLALVVDFILDVNYELDVNFELVVYY